MFSWIKRNKDPLIIGCIFLVLGQIITIVKVFDISFLYDVNEVYLRAAKFNSNTIPAFIVSSIIAFLISLVFLVGFLSIYMNILSKRKFKERKILKTILKTNEDLDNMRSEIAKARELESSKIEKRVKHLNKLSLMLLVVMIVLVVMFVVSSFQSFIMPSILNDTFDNAVEIITPYTTSDNINHIKSEWRLMKNQDDFNKINEQLLAIRNDNDLW